jgi:hypothetical protein
MRLDEMAMVLLSMLNNNILHNLTLFIKVWSLYICLGLCMCIANRCVCFQGVCEEVT